MLIFPFEKFLLTSFFCIQKKRLFYLKNKIKKFIFIISFNFICRKKYDMIKANTGHFYLKKKLEQVEEKFFYWGGSPRIVNFRVFEEEIEGILDRKSIRSGVFEQ